MAGSIENGHPARAHHFDHYLEAAKDLKLKPGDRAFAIIKASEVIVGK